MSSCAAIWRCSFRKPRIRSRAAGSICGDSVAAASPATMSSLRRRAICTQRARSIARSSIGGRARARTTAPESDGSTSSRSHARTSLTSARSKSAAPPLRLYGTARSSSAEPIAWPSCRTERTRTATSDGCAPSRSSRSISAAAACACARSLEQRQNRSSPPCAASAGAESRSGLSATTACAAPSSSCGERCERSRRSVVVPGSSAAMSWRFLEAAARARWIAWSGSPAAVRPRCSRVSARTRRRCA